MGKYTFGRLLLLIPTLIGMSLLIFLMLRLLPGDIVDILAGPDLRWIRAPASNCGRRWG